MQDRKENKNIGTFSFVLFNFITFISEHYFVGFIQKLRPFNKGHLSVKPQTHSTQSRKSPRLTEAFTPKKRVPDGFALKKNEHELEYFERLFS
jgi:hypothetical protein